MVEGRLEPARVPKNRMMVAANRELNDREFGKVRQNIGVEIGRSPFELALEAMRQEQRRLPAKSDSVTVTVIEE